jgi:hypothetical protein
LHVTIRIFRRYGEVFLFDLGSLEKDDPQKPSIEELVYIFFEQSVGGSLW